VVLLSGTLNRVMIVELDVPAWLVALMVSLPLVFAPLRALIGHRSDNHRSFLGWRRVPYIWIGTLLQFGGLAIMPFALLILSGDTHGPAWIGHIGGGARLPAHRRGPAHDADCRPRARCGPRARRVAAAGRCLPLRDAASRHGRERARIRPTAGRVQPAPTDPGDPGCRVLTMVLNLVALWKQEPRDPARNRAAVVQPSFRAAWRELVTEGRSGRFLLAVGLGTMAFSMQDILLEPYGGEILGLAVAATTTLTAFLAFGTLVAFALAARRLGRGDVPCRLAGFGALIGVAAFSAVIFAASLESAWLFRAGTALIGFGGGLFAVGTLTAAMAMDSRAHGLALGAWGAVQASAAGIGIALGGAIRDGVGTLASAGLLGPALTSPVTGYSFVYHIEIALLFATLVAIGPLVRPASASASPRPTQFGLAEFPG
jgi:MFS transporter, BCD family, chlorophyll transporter